MVAVMMAKWIGDYITHPLYHSLLELYCIPFLDSEPIVYDEQHVLWAALQYIYPRRRLSRGKRVVFSSGFVCVSVDRSVCQHNISKTNATRIANLTQKCPRWVLEIRLFWGQKIKDRGRKAQKNKSVSLQTECNIAAGWERKPRWVFPAAGRHYHARQTDRRFFGMWSYSQSASGKNNAGVGRGTSVSSLLASSSARCDWGLWTLFQ